ncbi:tautomerase family protein [Bradyrhizobium sp. URHD0069]|uniref:tautomerase family protein n=1 Tax=Bradyrhizobium sp. URHD0069 TaxID=1380355 RepID=UPI0012DD4601
MATYTIQIPGGQLSDERKAALPEAVKDAHAKTTGAPRDLTQATVLEISSACSGCTARRWSATRSSSMASSLPTRGIPAGRRYATPSPLRWRALPTSNRGASW